MPKPRNWIAGAIKHKGALRNAAKRHHRTTTQEIRVERKSKNPTQRRRGNLAVTLKRLRPKGPRKR